MESFVDRLVRSERGGWLWMKSKVLQLVLTQYLYGYLNGWNWLFGRCWSLCKLLKNSYILTCRAETMNCLFVSSVVLINVLSCSKCPNGYVVGPRFEQYDHRFQEGLSSKSGRFQMYLIMMQSLQRELLTLLL